MIIVKMRRNVCCLFSNKWFYRYQWSIFLLALLALFVYNASMSNWIAPEQQMPICTQTQAVAEPVVKILEDNVRLLDTSSGTEDAAYKPVELMSSLDVRLGRWDASRLYKLFDNVVVGDEFSEISAQRKVSLATQTSMERMDGIVEIADHWDGPISMAIFAADDELHFIKVFILYLMSCESEKFSRMAIHLVMPTVRMASNEPNFRDRMHLIDSCPPAKALVKTLTSLRRKDTSKWRMNNVYPQNHLRNLARKNCQTPLTFLVDVDIIPSPGAAAGLELFLKSNNCKMCAFVVPTYELDERVWFPANKSLLISLSKKGLAVPFHKKVFIFNQYASNFSRWEVSGGNESSDVHVSHQVTNFELLYEPFYVASDAVPPHDERFLGYGYTRNSQVYEMFLMGYKFQVLSPIFTIHWGIQHRKTRPLWRERQNQKNSKIFQTFKRELFARYRKDPLKLLQKVSPHKAKLKS